MTRISHFIFLLSVMTLGVRGGPADKYCCLCGGCKQMVPGRGGLFLDSYGLTCGQLELDMTGNYAPSTTECTDLQNKHRQACCDASYTPFPIVQPPPPPPGSNYPQGNEPLCDLCLDASFPTKPYTITAVLYIPGNPTCQDLYYMGRAGTIPGRLCYPLQDYMQGPCGCTDPTFDPDGKPPTVAPTPEPNSLPDELTRRGPRSGGLFNKDDLRLPVGGRTRGGTLRGLKGEA